ncbi:MAG: glutamine-hydrolyzing GMP synthase [Chloroflexi bacterium]|nr:glutamine-hydrolyzing GMP synthase [Chloroflexota bacterium]
MAPFAPDAGAAHETIVVLDFGAQYSQLIARRVRELGVRTVLAPCDEPDALRVSNLRGVILSGGPTSVYDKGAPQLPPAVLTAGVPVLGICYGMQLLGHSLGGSVEPADDREYGPALARITDSSHAIFRGVPDEIDVWMSHGDVVADVPPGFRALARTQSSMAAMGNDNGVVAVQFHPEVRHTTHGRRLLYNFAVDMCGCRGDWVPASIIDERVAQIRRQVGNGHVICGLSGGVDSAVTAALVSRAVGDRLTAILIDTGLLRADEAAEVESTFGQGFDLQLIIVDAADEFLAALRGVTDPEAKRQVIGERFVRVFEREAARIADADFLAQGTIYPDVIESGGIHGSAAVIKSHHNVGGLPDDLEFELVEPLRDLFKDEVRALGSQLGLPEALVWRQPFPGPGLAVRIVGEVTASKVALLQQADAILRAEIAEAGLERQLSQYFAVLPGVQTVGVMGDGRSYGELIALRAVTTDDFMTADWARIPSDVLARISARVVNEVPNATRVVYDVTSKPPGTIEWE